MKERKKKERIKREKKVDGVKGCSHLCLVRAKLNGRDEVSLIKRKGARFFSPEWKGKKDRNKNKNKGATFSIQGRPFQKEERKHWVRKTVDEGVARTRAVQGNKEIEQCWGRPGEIFNGCRSVQTKI